MILKAIQERRSIRSYKNNPVSDEQIIKLIKAAQFAPNSHHNRSWEFIVIRNQDIKKVLYDLMGQGYIKDAPVLIVPTIDTTKSMRPIQDISTAAENIFLQAASMGIGTVWKNVVKEKVSLIKKLLNIPQQFTLINIIPVGYPKTKRRPHNDSDFDVKKIHYEEW